MDRLRTPGRRLAPSSRLLVRAMVACLVLFATGVGPRPPQPFWGFLYDLVLYNLVTVLAAGVCLCAAVRSAVERTAWLVMGIGLLLDMVGNVLYSVVIVPMADPPTPSIADAFYLAWYPALYVAIIGVIRKRVVRFHPSMWLDGLIGALGAAAVAAAVLLAPALQLTRGSTAAVLTNLAYPVADVVLLALLFAVAAILGIRRDPVLLLLAAGIVVNLVGDCVYLDLATRGIYVEGGPLDLTWLAAMVLVAVAAHVSGGAGSPPVATGAAQSASRVGWRLLAVPLACNLASLVVLGVGWTDRLLPVAGWCAVGCVLAALARTAVTFREVRTFHEVKAQAHTDELTGLPNRRALLERAREVLAAASTGQPAALLLLDLDGFKEVNDGLGHSAGDQLLRQVGPRLAEGLRPGDLLARLGGDEFAVLLPDTGLVDAVTRAEALRGLLMQPFLVEDIRLHVGASIGVSTAPVPAADVTELLRCADVAMYAAKSAREGVHAYVPDPRGGTADRLRTMEELRVALTDGQLVVHLQPQLALDDLRVVGAEALVRWQHPVRGLLSPAELLPAAEQAGLLRPLMDTVLELALTATAGWWPHRRVPVSVNLSAANVTDLDLPAKVAAALLQHGLPPESLTLELVEDTLMADPERGRAVLGELRRLGVRTSIDDYGTGYSSLAYLRTLPADELKLDRSLIADVAADPRAAAIVRHTVALAHDLGLSLVAEGVEDERTGAALAALGCDIAQGYAIGRPMPVAGFLDWLERPVTFLSSRVTAG